MLDNLAFDQFWNVLLLFSRGGQVCSLDTIFICDIHLKLPLEFASLANI